ncbi:hypothetical protein [Clostridium paraputrificum]|uniref:hypothetical protein n=1 Tax=Clostridium paraputrificum TaxID=29363 RepID=UPI00189F3B22|nr:hypothetical protein [Clostridium paraputrificum]
MLRLYFLNLDAEEYNIFDSKLKEYGKDYKLYKGGYLVINDRKLITPTEKIYKEITSDDFITGRNTKEFLDLFFEQYNLSFGEENSFECNIGINEIIDDITEKDLLEIYNSNKDFSESLIKLATDKLSDYAISKLEKYIDDLKNRIYVIR